MEETTFTKRNGKKRLDFTTGSTKELLSIYQQGLLNKIKKKSRCLYSSASVWTIRDFISLSATKRCVKRRLLLCILTIILFSVILMETGGRSSLLTEAYGARSRNSKTLCI